MIEPKSKGSNGEKEENVRSAEDLLTKRGGEEENQVQQKGDRRINMYGETEVPVSADTSWQSEVEPNKEDEDEVEPLDFGKNEELEWKVSERKPIHVCKRASNSKDKGCVFALCGNCFEPPNVRGCAGRKRKQRVMTKEKGICNHKDMHTLLSFEAPSFFNEKYRANPVKHFPTKCPNCWIGFRECLIGT